MVVRSIAISKRMSSNTTKQAADLLIRNALIFDGCGGKPFIGDVAVSGDRIVEIGPRLRARAAATVVDADGKWLMPGLLDIHTHLDLEVELDPRLPEVVRHGTTTVVVGNCSLGLAFGAQLRDDENPIVDCFARVENLPKTVLQKAVERITWDNTADYLAHLAELPLGPNIVPLIPHSMLRVEVMGLKGSVEREPSEAELQQMEMLLEQGMQQGFAGFSTDALPFHYLANDPHRRTRIPTQFGSFAELKRLTHVVRRYGRVWQATPPKDDRWQTVKNFALTSGRLFGRPLKVTAVAALDVVSNRALARLALVLSKLFNSRLFAGHFRFQALAAPFRVYADGIITPLAEETPAFRELNERDLEDRSGRRQLLQDDQFRQRFRAAWYKDRKGLSVHRIKRWLGIMDDTLRRDLSDMRMTARPLPCWDGLTLSTIYQRYQGWRNNAMVLPEEASAFSELNCAIEDDCDFFMALLERFDTDLRWSVLAANDREQTIRKLLFHEQVLPGFNDSGAHLTNMAFYDGNLRGLQLAQSEGLMAVARHVSRLTREPAEFFGLDVGCLKAGAKADLVLLDPLGLARYNSEANTALQHRDVFAHEQMVNRSPGVVRQVWISGKTAWDGANFDPKLGVVAMGKPLLVGTAEADSPANEVAQAA